MKCMKTLLLLLILSLTAFAEKNKSIEGIVVDHKTGEPLIGAAILIVDTEAGTISDQFGQFRISGLESGNYTLEISFVGYQKTIRPLSISDKLANSVSIPLQPSSLFLATVEIGASSSQNIQKISALDLQMKPVKSAQEVLKIVPGLFIAQHAGGGKAEQIFLRGFDIDHGTDISLTVDGMPVNMVSHAHGQGYADLHFVIPETIDKVYFDKGPYYADKGNFTTAGFAAFNTKKIVNNNLVKIEGGRFGTARTLGMFNLIDGKNSTNGLYLATEYLRTDGYFESPQNFKRFNGLLKYYNRLSKYQTLEISTSAFSSKWRASGQIPERAVKSGLINRFGAIDDTEGGETSRFNFNFKLTTGLKNGGVLQNQFYFSQYDFKLLSNFTFFLNDPINGDRITQSENRQIYGASTQYSIPSKLFSLPTETKVGVGIRHDHVNDNRLYRVSSNGEVLLNLAFGNIQESNGYVFAEEIIQLSPKFNVSAGLRYDYFRFSYEDLLQSSLVKTQNKGTFSPKLKFNYKANKELSFYLKSGIGFHSNDSRSITSNQEVLLLPKAVGVDAGTFWKPTPNLFIQAALWTLNLEQELIYVGDEGITESSGKTRRYGVDVSIRYQVTPWLALNTDLNYANPKYTEKKDGSNYVPLAPTFTSTGGVNINLSSGFKANLRYRLIRDRAANEDRRLVAEGYSIWDSKLSYTIGAFEIGITAENLLNREWKEAQFETESRLKNETESVNEIHFTPGTPFQIRASVAYNF